MTTVATVAFCFGFLLVAGAGIFLLLIIADLRALWILHRLRPSPVGTRGRVAIEGTTEYSEAGRQIGPVTGEDCTWYRVTLFKMRISSFVTSDDHEPEVILKAESPAWPALADKNRRIPVHPRLVTPRDTVNDPFMSGASVYQVTDVSYDRADPVPLPPIVPASVIAGLRKSERLHLTETRVPRGLPVFAMGRVTNRGLLPNRTGLTVFTTDSRAAIIADRRDAVRTGRLAALWLTVIGLALAVPSTLYLIAQPG
ncbi:hypothetical protein [Paractinoplanes brasiliensis]|uniref:Uncharacterized protein n=1 Tax=Paractinoplanes brasiliensis TaxID=52695 RepID=A0A4R6JZE3_9ACTN|nr:hypothetical protein [Actinoplanes brasiliensis]TDO42283.1 hypothetical protein C8E87_6050 [Actinoplanes brasiliensis]GID29509.1 hypothetical protein Abr02nite_44920 [Actinoplanes brasiliensis]